MTAPWRIVHLDLSAGLADLSSGDRGVFLVLWWRDWPLGQLEIERAQLPIRLPELANRIAQAITPTVGFRMFKQGFDAPLPSNRRTPPVGGAPEDLATLLSVISSEVEGSRDYFWKQTPQPAPTPLHSARDDAKVSVVVCTRDRAEALDRCLQALARLSPSPHEIIVVDNAPQTDATRAKVTSWPDVRYMLEPRPGLDIARNTGARNSTGGIVAFADDDVEVHPAWITRLRDAFAEPEVMAVTGLVLPAELETEAQYLFENYWGFNRGYRTKIFDSAWFARELPRGVPADQIGAGANMAFRREIFARIGWFDERLDVGAAGCSGDSEFWYRILAHGGKCRYEPSAIVFHHHRRTLENLHRQIFFYMRGHVAASLVQFEKFRHWGNLRRLLLTLPRFYLESLVGSLLKPHKRQTLWPQVAGYFSGLRFYFMHR